MPIGGAYRLIDVPMSNCINSGISKIYILTQFNSTSLNRHLARTYNMGSGVRFGGEGFVEVLAATQVWMHAHGKHMHSRAWLPCCIHCNPAPSQVTTQLASGAVLLRNYMCAWLQQQEVPSA